MRISTLALLATASLSATSILAVPAPSLLDLDLPNVGNVAGRLVNTVDGWFNGKEKVIDSGRKKIEEIMMKGMEATKMVVNGIEYESITHPAHPEYRLRITSHDVSPSTDSSGDFLPNSIPTICDPNVRQISGYLDISSTKHLFFWFFESRSKPSTDPLVLWLNGGPGCSSTTGLLFELGPCSIANEGGGDNVTVVPNKWSFTDKANMIFLDQPVGVGYSYAEPGSEVNNSPAAAADVYAFLTLFISKYTKYSKNDFHISGESYAGTYLPNIAHVIHTSNKALSTPSLLPSTIAPLPKLNLKSVLIGNGLTEPGTQFGSVPEYACDSEYRVYEPDSRECDSLRSKMSRCQRAVDACYKSGSKFACVPAGLLCWSGFSQLQDLGLNLYDTRKTCDRAEDKDGPLCYKAMGWIERYLNQPEVKKELGAPENINFKSCDMTINQNFLLQGDAMHNTALLLPELVEDGIRLVIYAGVRDLMCNAIGNEQWLDKLATSYNSEFLNSTATPFVSGGKEAGFVRHAGEGAGNVAYVAVYEAGHMVPTDQPEAALDLFQRWLANKPLAKGH